MYSGTGSRVQGISAQAERAMHIYLKQNDGSLKSVHVYEGNIINLATGNVESSQFVATIQLDNGLEHAPDVFSVEVSPRMTIKELKDLIEDRKRISSGLQILIHNEKELETWKTLEHYEMFDAPLLIKLFVRELLPTSDSDSSSNSS